MKNKILLLIFTLLTLPKFSYCQNNTATEFKTDHLIGIWILVSNHDNDNLIFKRKINSEHNYGSSIEILKNGEFYNKYSAPCGNDRKLRTHNYTGKWTLNTKDWIITTTEPINRKGSIFKIVELNYDKLIIKEIELE